MVGGVGLASLACYLSQYLGIPLPRDIIFLGKVECRGKLRHSLPVSKHYLDFCLEEGFTRIVGPSSDMNTLGGLATDPRYQGIILTGLNNALEIVTEVFQPLRPVDEGEGLQ